VRLASYWFLVLVGAAACSGGSGGSDGGGTQPGGPSVNSLDLSPSNLTEGESTMVTALVADPDGADDILGGVLRAGAGGPSLATFTSAGAGTFTASVSWDDIHAAVDTLPPIPRRCGRSSPTPPTRRGGARGAASGGWAGRKRRQRRPAQDLGQRARTLFRGPVQRAVEAARGGADGSAGSPVMAFIHARR